jgi:hypothetical protein
MSCHPNRAGNWAGSPPLGEVGVYTNYDPTNGTVSIGNIIRTQNTTDKFNPPQADSKYDPLWCKLNRQSPGMFIRALL